MDDTLFGYLITLVIFGLILVIEGITGALKPERYWNLYQWNLKFYGVIKAEPTQNFYAWQTILAIVRVLLGIFILVTAWSIFTTSYSAKVIDSLEKNIIMTYNNSKNEFSITNNNEKAITFNYSQCTLGSPFLAIPLDRMTIESKATKTIPYNFEEKKKDACLKFGNTEDSQVCPSIPNHVSCATNNDFVGDTKGNIVYDNKTYFGSFNLSFAD